MINNNRRFIMTNRTIQILGQGYGTEPATMTVTYGGIEVFSGSVNTLPPEDIPSLPNLAIGLDTVLMSFEVPVSYSGTQAMTCTVTSGMVIFSQILANYQSVPNVIFTLADLEVLSDPGATPAEKIAIVSPLAVPPLTAEEITVLESTNPDDFPAQKEILISHNVWFTTSGGSDFFADVDGTTDPRDNVTINDVPVTPDHGSLPGTWWFQISQGQTLGYDLTVQPGM